MLSRLGLARRASVSQEAMGVISEKANSMLGALGMSLIGMLGRRRRYLAAPPPRVGQTDSK